MCLKHWKTFILFINERISWVQRLNREVKGESEVNIETLNIKYLLVEPDSCKEEL